jgi:hypothetical protein
MPLRVSQSLVEGQALGTEGMLDDIEIALSAEINEALEHVYDAQAVRDEARALRRGQEYVPMDPVPIPPEHFHVGNFPRMVLEEVPGEMYPYVVLAIEDAVPDAESGRQDHMNVFRQALAVHSLAEASEDEGSEIVYRRAMRMGEAVHLVMSTNPTCKRLLQGMPNPTRGQSSIPWTYRAQGRNGNRAWYQAVGLTYAIKIYTTSYDQGGVN